MNQNNELVLHDAPDNGAFPMALIEKAISGGAGIEVLERLMGLQERWEANNARKAFTAALSEAKNHMPRTIKNTEVKFGNTQYKHEDLGEMVEVLTPVLAEHGLSFRFRPDSSELGKVTITCVLAHADGHSEEATLSGPIDNSGGKNAIQGVGSVVSYLQRYTLKCILGIAASNDDDGRQGAPQGQAPRPQGNAQPQQSAPKSTQHAQQAPTQASAQVEQPAKAQLERFNELLNWRLNVEGGIQQGEYDRALEWLKTASKKAVGAKIGEWKLVRDNFEQAIEDEGLSHVTADDLDDSDQGEESQDKEPEPIVGAPFGDPIGEDAYKEMEAYAKTKGVTTDNLMAKVRTVIADALKLSAQDRKRFPVYNMPEGLIPQIVEGWLDELPDTK